MELRVNIKNKDTVITTTRNVLAIDNIIERANFGYETLSVEIPNADIAKHGDGSFDLSVGYTVDVYISGGTLDNLVYGGIIYDYKILTRSGEDADAGTTTLFLESHAHGLEMRNFRNNVKNKFLGNTIFSGSGAEKSIVNVYNNANILKLTPKAPASATGILMNGISPDQTLRNALDEYAFETGGYWTVEPDGSLVSRSYATEIGFGVQLIPASVYIDAEMGEEYEGIVNRDQRFLRALKDGNQDVNGAQTISTTGDIVLGSFTPTETYKIAGVAFLIDNPANTNFTLYLSSTTSSGDAIQTYTGMNLADAEKHELAVLPMYKSITNITLTSGSPVQITAPSHGFTTGQVAFFDIVGGTVELNDTEVGFTLTNTGTNTFTLDGTDGDNFSPYIGGGRTYVDAKYYRYKTFDVLQEVGPGTTYRWIARYVSTGGNAPNIHFGNIFNIGSRTKDSALSFQATALERQNRTAKTITFSVPLDANRANPTGAYRIGRYMRLGNAPTPDLEEPNFVIRKEIDFRERKLIVTLGTIEESIADKIRRLGVRRVS